MADNWRLYKEDVNSFLTYVENFHNSTHNKTNTVIKSLIDDIEKYKYEPLVNCVKSIIDTYNLQVSNGLRKKILLKWDETEDTIISIFDVMGIDKDIARKLQNRLIDLSFDTVNFDVNIDTSEFDIKDKNFDELVVKVENFKSDLQNDKSNYRLKMNVICSENELFAILVPILNLYFDTLLTFSEVVVKHINKLKEEYDERVKKSKNNISDYKDRISNIDLGNVEVSLKDSMKESSNSSGKKGGNFNSNENDSDIGGLSGEPNNTNPKSYAQEGEDSVKITGDSISDLLNSLHKMICEMYIGEPKSDILYRILYELSNKITDLSDEKIVTLFNCISDLYDCYSDIIDNSSVFNYTKTGSIYDIVLMMLMAKSEFDKIKEDKEKIVTSKSEFYSILTELSFVVFTLDSCILDRKEVNQKLLEGIVKIFKKYGSNLTIETVNEYLDKLIELEEFINNNQDVIDSITDDEVLEFNSLLVPTPENTSLSVREEIERYIDYAKGELNRLTERYNEDFEVASGRIERISGFVTNLGGLLGSIASLLTFGAIGLEGALGLSMTTSMLKGSGEQVQGVSDKINEFGENFSGLMENEIIQKIINKPVMKTFNRVYQSELNVGSSFHLVNYAYYKTYFEHTGKVPFNTYMFLPEVLKFKMEKYDTKYKTDFTDIESAAIGSGLYLLEPSNFYVIWGNNFSDKYYALQFGAQLKALNIGLDINGVDDEKDNIISDLTKLIRYLNRYNNVYPDKTIKLEQKLYYI